MKLPANFYRPLAIGAPLPLRELPVRPERMIHFFPPHVEKLGPADLAASRGMKTTRVGGGHPFYGVLADPGPPRTFTLDFFFPGSRASVSSTLTLIESRYRFPSVTVAPYRELSRLHPVLSELRLKRQNILEGLCLADLAGEREH